MKKKMIGRVMSLGLTMALAVSGISMPAQAAENTGNDVSEFACHDDDLMEFEVIELTDEELTSSDLNQMEGNEEEFKNSAVYESNWNKYQSYYYYNQLGTAEKAFWDALVAECNNYLDTTVDAVARTSSGNTYYTTSMVRYSGSLGKTTMKEIAYAFRYSNPQYYFLKSGMVLNSTSVAFQIFPIFANGASRQTATTNFFGKVNAYEQIIAQQTSEFDKVHTIAQLLCDNVEYNWTEYNNKHANENTVCTQSAYSTFMLGTTVCAGYALGFQLLCNAFDIECKEETSSSHAWNNVRVEDNWYMMDITNMDQEENGKYYGYFLRPVSASEFSKSTYKLDTTWSLYSRPEMTLDTLGSSKWKFGAMPSVSTKVENPQITVSDNVATISCATAGATIYYTTDGKTPAESSSRSTKYTGSFTVSDTSGLRAIAVMNGAKDSDVVKVGDAIPTPTPAPTPEPTPTPTPAPNPTPAPTPSPTTQNLLESFVSRMYTVVLNRAPEPAGLQHWVSGLVNKTSDGATVAAGFISSDEFVNKNLNNSAYLNIMYSAFFDRLPDEGGYNYWMSQLSSGVSRGEVLAGFVNSSEFTALCVKAGILRGYVYPNGVAANAGIGQFVSRLYNKALGRDGEADGINFWTTEIASGRQTAEQAATTGFFTSTEFTNKNLSNADFLTVLYATFFDRLPDEGGMAYWLTCLYNGMDRIEVVKGFAQSNEFKAIMASYGL